MSKTTKRNRRDTADFDDFAEFSYEEKYAHLREKRLRRALKTKNVEDLLDLDEDF